MSPDEMAAELRAVAEALREAGMPAARLLPTREVVRYSLADQVRMLAGAHGHPQRALRATSEVDVVAVYEQREMYMGSAPPLDPHGGELVPPVQRIVAGILLHRPFADGTGDLVGIRLTAKPSPQFAVGQAVRLRGHGTPGAVLGTLYGGPVGGASGGWTYAVSLVGSIAPTRHAESELEAA